MLYHYLSQSKDLGTSCGQEGHEIEEEKGRGRDGIGMRVEYVHQRASANMLERDLGTLAVRKVTVTLKLLQNWLQFYR